MKDYYQILGISPDAGEEQIRRSYRAQALKYHPDRNPGNPEAEERFKAVAEAYGVLIDPVKRREYDALRRTGGSRRQAAGGFQYSQEDIFRDIFRDPRFNAVFHELFREFQRAGVRGDQRFFNQTFFGGRGFMFGGVFFFSPFGSQQARGHAGQARVSEQGFPQLKPLDALKRLGRRVSRIIGKGPKQLPGHRDGVASGDLTYSLVLDREAAENGTWVKVALDRGSGRESLKVKVPARTKSGTRLRIRGKGMKGPDPGDLYLVIRVS